MNDIVLIHNICFAKTNINKIPKWKFISRYKQSKYLNSLLYEFINLDIFYYADSLISFLLSVDTELVNLVDGFLSYTNNSVSISIMNNGLETTITYFNLTKRFEISNSKISFTVTHNTEFKEWDSIAISIRYRYLDIINQLTDIILDIKK